ncbi:MAG: phosphoribosyltransferase family protein [Gammaproteobacteria bacterium]|jgi:hypoxanthine phosphoribosyltransferase|nr:phosphoribosyltransferase family protein [Gammaproteobacteria bacterium]MDH5171062.1 phosphoribosyltransferase family protein [Gammaproteobacteria bacterium]
MSKQYISPQQLLADAFALAAQVFASGFRPTWVIGVWRGGTPVAIAVHELLQVLGVETDHAAIRTSSYTGIGQREETIRVDGLDQLVDQLEARDSLLLVDDVHDTGLSLQQVITDLRRACGVATPDIRIATPYFKPGNNRTGRDPDYFLHRTDDWLVFPHELEGLSLAEIRANKPELAAVLPLLEGRLG